MPFYTGRSRTVTTGIRATLKNPQGTRTVRRQISSDSPLVETVTPLFSTASIRFGMPAFGVTSPIFERSGSEGTTTVNWEFSEVRREVCAVTKGAINYYEEVVSKSNTRIPDRAGSFSFNATTPFGVYASATAQVGIQAFSTSGVGTETSPFYFYQHDDLQGKNPTVDWQTYIRVNGTEARIADSNSGVSVPGVGYAREGSVSAFGQELPVSTIYKTTNNANHESSGYPSCSLRLSLPMSDVYGEGHQSSIQASKYDSVLQNPIASPSFPFTYTSATFKLDISKSPYPFYNASCGWSTGLSVAYGGGVSITNKLPQPGTQYPYDRSGFDYAVRGRDMRLDVGSSQVGKESITHNVQLLSDPVRTPTTTRDYGVKLYGCVVDTGYALSVQALPDTTFAGSWNTSSFTQTSEQSKTVIFAPIFNRIGFRYIKISVTCSETGTLRYGGESHKLSSGINNVTLDNLLLCQTHLSVAPVTMLDFRSIPVVIQGGGTVAMSQSVVGSHGGKTSLYYSSERRVKVKNDTFPRPGDDDPCYLAGLTFYSDGVPAFAHEGYQYAGATLLDVTLRDICAFTTANPNCGFKLTFNGPVSPAAGTREAEFLPYINNIGAVWGGRPKYTEIGTGLTIPLCQSMSLTTYFGCGDVLNGGAYSGIDTYLDGYVLKTGIHGSYTCQDANGAEGFDTTAISSTVELPYLTDSITPGQSERLFEPDQVAQYIRGYAPDKNTVPNPYLNQEPGDKDNPVGAVLMGTVVPTNHTIPDVDR